MRPLYGLGHDVAAWHFEIFALESWIGIHREHVQTLLDAFAPHLALLLDGHAEPAEFEQRRGFTGPNSTRPRDTRSSVAMRSATRAG